MSGFMARRRHICIPQYWTSGPTMRYLECQEFQSPSTKTSDVSGRMTKIGDMVRSKARVSETWFTAWQPASVLIRWDIAPIKMFYLLRISVGIGAVSCPFIPESWCYSFRSKLDVSCMPGGNWFWPHPLVLLHTLRRNSFNQLHPNRRLADTNVRSQPGIRYTLRQQLRAHFDFLFKLH